MTQAEIKRFKTIARLLDNEAESWATSFAVGNSKGEWKWPDDPETKEFHARFIRLESAAKFLRTTADKYSKTENDFQI